MSTEYFDTLEQQLIDASRRLSNEHSARRRRRWMGRRPILVALLGLTCATTAFAVSDEAPWSPPELTLRENQANVPPLIAGSVPTSLSSFLGVFRRPQTEVDRGEITREALKYFNSGTPGGIRSDAIRAVVAGDPETPSLVIVPFDVKTATGTETQLKVWVTDRGAAGGKVIVPPSIFEHPRAFGSMGRYVFGMAPDGVTAVRLSWPDHPSIEAPVTDNVYVVRGPEGTLPGVPAAGLTVTWLDAQGASVPGRP